MRKLPCDLKRKLPMCLHLLLDARIDNEQLHIFLVLRVPDLDAVHPMETCKGRVEGDNHLPPIALPAGHCSVDAAQGMVGFLCCKCPLLACIKFHIN